MEITEIKVFPVREEKLKAFVSVVIDECFMVNDIKVIKGREGFFISMPSRKKKNGKFKDVAHPLNNQTRQMMESKILGEYDRVVDSRQNGDRAADREVAEPALAAAAPASVEPVPPPRSEPLPEPELMPRQETEPRAESTPTTAVEPELEAVVPEAAAEPDREKTLDEVTELHLRDSFWNS